MRTTAIIAARAVTTSAPDIADCNGMGGASNQVANKTHTVTVRAR
jgi:hypothetical protein